MEGQEIVQALRSLFASVVRPLKTGVVSVVQQVEEKFSSSSGELVTWAELLRAMSADVGCAGAFSKHVPCDTGTCQPATVKLALEALRLQLDVTKYNHIVLARVDAEYKEPFLPEHYLHKADVVAPFWQCKPKKGKSELTDVSMALPVHAVQAYVYELERLATSSDQFDQGSLH